VTMMVVRMVSMLLEVEVNPWAFSFCSTPKLLVAFWSCVVFTWEAKMP